MHSRPADTGTPHMQPGAGPAEEPRGLGPWPRPSRSFWKLLTWRLLYPKTNSPAGVMATRRVPEGLILGPPGPPDRLQGSVSEQPQCQPKSPFSPESPTSILNRQV